MSTVNGYVDHIIFQNKENGYTVLMLVTGEEEITCVGFCRGLTQGETIRAQGEMREHPVYGSQFKISSYESVIPGDKDGIERYLSCGAVKGIGATLAARIVEKFGDDTFRVMEEEPQLLAQVKGISERKAQEIACEVEAKRDERDAFVYLQQFGISNALAIKIYDTYGAQLYGIIKENPYQLAEDIDGVGFRTADGIARLVGIHPDCDYRIKSGIMFCLTGAVGEGHCYLPVEILIKRAVTLLETEEESVRIQLENLMMERKIVIKNNAVYAASYYYMELSCAGKLKDMNIPLWKEKKDSREKIKALSRDLHAQADELQLEAVLEAAECGVFILTGGPGTGKTTTINMMIRFFESEGMDVLLAAPTGRAAKRMTQATGYEARTVHRLLEVNGSVEDGAGRGHFERNESNPLEADAVIIDEMSMVDINLFYALLEALVPGTRLILVGDVDQLPSVGPGQVLRDLLMSDAFAHVALKKIFRQATESDIVINAHRINAGEQIRLDNKSRDFFMLERTDANVIYKHMIQLITDMLPGYVNVSPMEIQVLTPMKRGNLGAETLNVILQRHLNSPDPGKREYQAGNTLLREGDKVMQTRNNYQLEWEVVSKYGIPVERGTGVFNGDMGRVISINEPMCELVVEYDDYRRVTYPFSALDELELSYAITIHKSQGSEYPAVIIPLLGGSKRLLNRNLLYTGVTRATNCVVILGSSETVRNMIANASENRRYTSLADRIVEMGGCGAEKN